MAIVYPLTFPGLSGILQPLILQAADSTFWQLTVDNDGVLQTTVVGAGPAQTLKLMALDGSVWQITVDNDGILLSTASSGTSIRDWMLEAADEGRWSLQVRNDGVLTTSKTGGYGVSGLFSAIRFRATAVVGLSMSPFTYQQQAQVHEGQMWSAEFTIAQLFTPDGENLLAMLLALNGRQGTFYLSDPTSFFPRGTPTGTPVVNGASQTGQTLTTRGWGNSSPKVLKRGDYIQLGSGTTQRIYRVLQDVDSGATGLATIDIWPRLRESPSDGEALVLTYPAGVFRLPDNNLTWDIEPPEIYGFEFSAMEAI